MYLLSSRETKELLNVSKTFSLLKVKPLTHTLPKGPLDSNTVIRAFNKQANNTHTSRSFHKATKDLMAEGGTYYITGIYILVLQYYMLPNIYNAIH